MKLKKLKSIFIVAILVAFLALGIGFVFGANTYPARAEEVFAEPSQESVEEPTNDDSGTAEETPDFDLNDFLAWVQKYADEAGIGNEYAKAVEAIRTAASQKQVTISTVSSVAQLAVFIVYLIYTNVKNGKLKKQLKEVSEKLDLQIRGTNGLIDESNHNGLTSDSTKRDVEALKKALGNFTKAFMQFSDRTNIGAESKEAIKHDLNAALRDIDDATDKEKADEKNKTL